MPSRVFCYTFNTCLCRVPLVFYPLVGNSETYASENVVVTTGWIATECVGRIWWLFCFLQFLTLPRRSCAAFCWLCSCFPFFCRYLLASTLTTKLRRRKPHFSRHIVTHVCCKHDFSKTYHVQDECCLHWTMTAVFNARTLADSTFLCFIPTWFPLSEAKRPAHWMQCVLLVILLHRAQLRNETELLQEYLNFCSNQ